MFTCLPQDKAQSFKKDLKEKEIDLKSLLNMTTEQRTEALRPYAGELVKEVNTLFEEKLVLKNRIAGLKNWASKVGQIGRYDPAKKAQLEQKISDYRAAQQQRIFSPKEHEQFLNDLADETIGTHVTKSEAANLFELTSKADELKKAFDGEKWTSEKTAKDYGAAKVALEKYTDALKEGELSVKDLIKKTLAETKETFDENKPKAVADLLLKTVKTISDNSISMVASLDNSFMGRQGLKTLITHPTVWWEGAKNSFVDMAKTLGGQNMKDALLADIYSRPNYLNGNYELAKILPKAEEQYPTSIPERLPGLGRVFKASQSAFEGSAIRMRTGLYDLLSEVAKKNEVDMTDKYQIQSLGKMINSLTARGQWGKTGEPAVVRLILWAPKMLKANIDVLTSHFGQDISPFARKQAAINLIKIVSTSAAIMTLANAIKPGSAETDPRSTNFGKIKVGNTTFDYTGGAGSLIVLAARQITGASKSATTGIVKQFGIDYGQQTRFDTLIDFLVGKTTPPVGAIIALMKGKNPIGEVATPKTELERVVTPIIVQNALDLKDDHSVEAILGVLLDAVGINANTFVRGETDWTLNPGVELQAFQKKVGEEKFKQANDLYNQKVTTWLKEVQTKPVYQNLSDEDKQKIITKKRGEIKDAIFKQYNFKYKAPVTKKLPKL